MDPKVAGLREDAIAAWREVDTFYSAHVVDGELPAEHQPALDELNSKAQAADAAYAKAASNAGIATTARARIDEYATAVTGSPVAWSKVVGGEPAPAGSGGRPKTLGERFVEAKAYKDLVASGALKSERSSIGHLPMFSAAADDIVRIGERGGDAPLAPFTRPTYIADVLPLPTAPRTLSSLFTQDTAPDGEIKDTRQTSRSGTAGAVAEAANATTDTLAGGLKPQVSANWESYSIFPTTIAAWMATTRQALSQENRTRTLIDGELALQIGLEEEEQIVNGNGTAPNLSGLLDQPDLQTFDAATFYNFDEDANLAAIRHAKTMVRTGIARIPADAVVVHPNDSERFDLIRNAHGDFRAGDPFNGSSDDQAPIWRLTRVESEAIDEGTAIVGAFKLGGTFYRVAPIAIFVTDSHEDWFVRNLLAILGEERVALLIRRPAAFVVVTLADWTTGS